MLSSAAFEAERRDFVRVHGTKPFFVSDWDVDRNMVKLPNHLIQHAFDQSSEDIHEYSFIDDQLWAKDHIGAHLAKAAPGTEELAFTLMPNATSGLYLTLTALSAMDKQRFLVIVPSFYSILDTLEDHQQSYYYYHLKDAPDHRFDFEHLESVVVQQRITAIIITDPIYSFGKSIRIEDVSALASLCNRRDCWLIHDHTLGGLEWDQPLLFPAEKLKACATAHKFVFTDSLTKRLLVNGLKFAIVHSTQEVIDKMEVLVKQITGGFTMPQLQFVKAAFDPVNEESVLSILAENAATLKRQYASVQSHLADSPFELSPINSGYFCSAVHERLAYDEVDEVATYQEVLNKHKLIWLPTPYLTSARHGRFSLRVNLFKDLEPQGEAMLRAACEGIIRA